MQVPTRHFVAATGYAVGVLLGAAILGLVVAPWLAVASGAFPIEADARAAFSWLVLRGFPFFVGLSIASAMVYDAVASRSRALRAVVFAANLFAVWLSGSGLALLLLG